MRGYWQQKIGSVLGLFAVLLVVFAPLVSQTLRANDPAFLALASFCSVTGPSQDGNGKEHQPAHAQNDQACAYCGLALHFPALPAASAVVGVAPQAVVFAPSGAATAFRPFQPTSLAQPRGPPVSA